MGLKQYKHLSWTARLQIESYLKTKTPVKEIADRLGVHISTIYREMKRGVYEHLNGATWLHETRYSPDIAETRYRSKLSAKGAPLKIGNNFALAQYIENRICEDKLSPVAVLGEIKHKKLFNTCICKTTLYSYIDKGVFLRLSLKNLPMKMRKKPHKRKVKAARPPKGISIERRPNEIGNRNTFGHWEMDCVCGSTKNTLLVLSERLTRKEIIFPMKNQKAESVIRCMNVLEHQYGKMFRKVFKTITVDNGSEFSDFHGIQRSRYGGRRTTVYYCHPYCSAERGTNERLNREIRRLIPKGSDLSKFAPEDIKKVEDWVNAYPRGVLGYDTSAAAFNKQLLTV